MRSTFMHWRTHIYKVRLNTAECMKMVICTTNTVTQSHTATATAIIPRTAAATTTMTTTTVTAAVAAVVASNNNQNIYGECERETVKLSFYLDAGVAAAAGYRVTCRV